MQLEVIPMLINSDFMEVSLDVLMYLADYKMYGESSFVYQDKSKLHKIYETPNVSMNDRKVNGDAFEYLLKSQSAGKILVAIHGLERKEQIEKLSTMSAIVNSQTAMSAIINSQTAISAIVNSQTAMSAIVNNQAVMSQIINNTKCREIMLNSKIAMELIANDTILFTSFINSEMGPIIMTNPTGIPILANSQKAMEVIVNNPNLFHNIINNQIFIQALSKSRLYVRLKQRQEVKDGLMLVMDMGKGSYNTSNYNDRTHGHIGYIDGHCYPPSGSYYEDDPNGGTWGFFLKKVPKVAKYVRTYINNDTHVGPNYMDVILIKGTVSNF